MASILVNKWPENKEEIYDNKQWVPKEWTIGEPITKEKLQNLDDGIAVLATQMDALLKEIEIDPSTIILNGTRLDTIQEWITGSTGGSYDIGGSGGDIASRLDTQNDSIEDIRGYIAGGSGYQNDNTIDDRLNSLESSIGTVESSIENIDSSIGDINSSIGDINYRVNVNRNNIESIETLISGESGSITSRIADLESNNSSFANRIENLESNDNIIKTWITDGSDYEGISLDRRLYNLETLVTDGNPSLTNRVGTLESIVGNGAIGTDSDISAAIRRLSDAVVALDPTGSAEATSFLVSEVWGQPFSQDTDFTANSRIDILETTTQNLGTQLSTLATEQNGLEQNLAATNEKIPIEMYVATNSTASDTIILDAVPRDKSIFFVAIPLGTLGQENLKLQTPDIQFADEIGQQPTSITLKKNYADPVIVKYPKNSIISIYRKDERDSNGNITSSNAYIINMTKIL